MSLNRFCTREWQERHLCDVSNQAGSRYSPQLNVDLPIAEIFDGIGRTQKFYTTIRARHGRLIRYFSRVHGGQGAQKAQRAHQRLKGCIDDLSARLGGIQEYDTNEIPWADIGKLARKAVQLVYTLSQLLRDAREKAKADAKAQSPSSNDPRSPSEVLGYDLHHLYQTRRELEDIESFAKSDTAQLSNRPFLCLNGIAGTGKTHLMCDVVKNRYAAEPTLPSVLVFGELFEPSVDPVCEIARLAGVSLHQDGFLRLLDNAGRQSRSRSLLIIDAINETRQTSFWRRSLGKLIKAVEQYPNVALVITVRSGFERQTVPTKWQSRLVRVEHRGFEFREWEAVSSFFEEFNLPLPEIPLLTPEFQNPLFLTLFCKAFSHRVKQTRNSDQRQVFRGHEGATYIFEAFVRGASKRILQRFGLHSSYQRGVWNSVIKPLAAEMVRTHDDRVPEEFVESLLGNAYPDIDVAKVVSALETNLLLVKLPRHDASVGDYRGFDYRFPFQKFSDHLIGRYIFKSYEEEFGKLNKNVDTAKRFFSRRRKLGKFLAEPWNRGIVEALSIQCPEHLSGHELIDIAPYLANTYHGQEAFIESLVWRKPTAFQRDLANTLTYINSTVIRTDTGHRNLVNAFLSVASVPRHPFNSEFLHKHLLRKLMPKRDSWWSTFLHFEYGQRRALDRLIEWGWSDEDRSHIKDEAIFLCATALVWFLTTPNRVVRDKSTKALVSLLTGRLSVVVRLLEKFQDVDDPYVSERLYAVAYGCAMRSVGDRGSLRKLAVWVYRKVFLAGSPPVHVLLRDYARGVVEVAVHNGISLRFSREKITPPFRSSWPKRAPTERTLRRKYYDVPSNARGLNYFGIWSSVMYDFGSLADFGNYVLNSRLSSWSGRALNGSDVNSHELYDDFKRSLTSRQSDALDRATNPFSGVDIAAFMERLRTVAATPNPTKPVKVRNPAKPKMPNYTEFEATLGSRKREFFQQEIKPFLGHRGLVKDPLDSIDTGRAQRWLFDRVVKIGWAPELHGEFDRDVNAHRVDRSEHKAERIGKKYQWIALHELLARASDNFEFKKDSWAGTSGDYEGPWQVSARDIDPSCTLKDSANTGPARRPAFCGHRSRDRYDPNAIVISDTSWLRKTSGLPDPKHQIELVDDHGTTWLALEAWLNWEARPAPELERYDVPTKRLWYIVKSYLVTASDKQKLYRWARQQGFNGRWMPESREFYDVYLGEYPWAPAFMFHYVPYYYHDGWTRGSHDKRLPASVLITDDEYHSSGSSIDCSTSESITVKLPAKFFVDEMKLKQDGIDGAFSNEANDLIALDPSVFDPELPRQVIVRKDAFCDCLEKHELGIVWTVLGEKNMIGGGGIGQPLGWLDISGAYTLGKRNNMLGAITAEFKKSEHDSE